MITIETNNAQYELPSEISLVIPKDIKISTSKFDVGKDNSRFTKCEKITKIYIKKKIANCSNIVFELTQECNFRCKYCAYSGIYPENRTHKSEHMDEAIAKGALKTFSNMVFSGSRINRSNITIGFYGGEPLLKLDLIKKIVYFSKLVKDEFGQEHKWSYRIATNGYLLTASQIDYFVKNNFFIDISIDGSEEEHDKFRVLKTGSSTWGVVWNNIIYVKKKYPDFFNRNVKFQITMHPDHNILHLESFLKHHNDIFNENNTSFSVLKMHGLEGDLFKSWKSKYKKALDNLRKLDKKFWLIEKLHPGKAKDKFSDRTYILKLNNKFTGNCFPGEVKVYVNTDGRFSICEKIYPGNYIGDYINGFNFDTIKELEKKWNKLIRERSCWQCNQWYFCNACYVRCEKQGDFVINSDFCKRVEISLRNCLSGYLELEEMKFENNSNNNNSITDIIDQL